MDTTRTRASSGSPYEATVGFSRAVRHGQHVIVSGTAPIWPDGHVMPEAGAQARRCWEIALGALAELGGSVSDVVRTRHFLTSVDDVRARAEAILTRVEEGAMPCDAMWPEERVALLRAWIETGMAP